ncbi:MAG: glycosyltransferase [Dehalococcoidia bacterium]|nr:glycosyltransferase [Dehalococcoidia bacterium]
MSSEWGGPVAVVSQLIRALSAEGVNCEIATARGRRVGTDISPIEDTPINSFETELPSLLWTAYSSPLARFLNENVSRFDLVHIHEIWHYAGYAAFHAAVRNSIPVVLTPHGELGEWHIRHKAWKKRIYMKLALDRILRGADALHAITVAEKERLKQLGYNTLVTVAPNGINPDQFDDLPDPSDFLDRCPALKGKQIILYLGRLNPTKGLDILARAFSAISSRFPDTVLLVAGPDEEGGRQLMESILKSEGVLDKVVFTGMLTGADKMSALACANVFVLPSYSEGFSIAVLEALAARLPVVISEGCNFPEVADHSAGFVVATGDRPVTDAIGTLLSKPDLRVQMGERGRKLVVERYTWQATASKIAELYRTLVAMKKTGYMS